VKPVWLTVDSDDLRHLPKHQGHPTRSKHPYSERVSIKMQQAMKSFRQWLDTTRVPLTIFVIADQLSDDEFNNWLSDLIDEHPQVTIGCHGLNHRSWSAWAEDTEGFAAALLEAIQSIHTFAGDSFRPWFRAPAGYIAPWMAPIISEVGFELDSSINPSWLTRSKTGRWKNWHSVRKAIADSGLIEMEWLTHRGLPTCGPALTIPFLKGNARRAWRRLGPAVIQSEAETTVYWHILDHAREDGKWLPPLQIANT
jgi:peptidoglycan/xylan/chitin deacetylase (PgdA/CDA1 family)